MKKTLLLLSVMTAVLFASCDLTSTYTVRALPNIYYSPDSASDHTQNIYVMQQLVELDFLSYASQDMIIGYLLQEDNVPTAKVNETGDKLYKELKKHYDAVYPRVLGFDYSTLFDSTIVQKVGFTLIAAWSDSTIYTVRIALPDTTKTN